MNKPFSQACENNKQAILQRIQPIFQQAQTVLEIGSGTGQHACYFAKQLPHLTWQATDRVENLPGIDAWIADAKLKNLPQSLALNVRSQDWPCASVECVFTANTLHIMHWAEVECFFNGLKKHLAAQAYVCIYGPFNYQGQYTSASNAQFDQCLKARDVNSGIRDFSALEDVANQAGLEMLHDFEMPANNRLLVLQKV